MLVHAFSWLGFCFSSSPDLSGVIGRKTDSAPNMSLFLAVSIRGLDLIWKRQFRPAVTRLTSCSSLSTFFFNSLVGSHKGPV